MEEVAEIGRLRFVLFRRRGLMNWVQVSIHGGAKVIMVYPLAFAAIRPMEFQ